MRVFVTGATGFVGSAVVQELQAAGHQVLGLARSDANADSLARLGVEVHRGDLTETASLEAGVRGCEGVIHTAFVHDFSQFQKSVEIERRAIEVMGATLAGTGRPLIISSGVALLPPGRLGTEDDEGDPNSAVSARGLVEGFTLAMASNGVRAQVIRLSPTVHGDGDHGFVPMIIALARQNGVSAFVGDGLNRWPAVHRLDSARLYRLAIEKGEAGARHHAVAEEGVPFREIAEVIGRRLNLPVVSISREDAAERYGFVGHFMGVDCPASSAKTRERLGWSPTGPGLIADVDHERYFGA